MEIPFSSSRKMMLTVTDVNGRKELYPGGMPLPEGTKSLAVCKGAPNFILEYCSEMLMPDGSIVKLTEEGKAEVLKAVDDYSEKAL
eukprot:9514608-Heterocapsa_arctica.AAC.1